MIEAEQKMRGLFNFVSRYLTAAGKCFQRTRYPAVLYSRPIFKNSHRIPLRKFDICAEISIYVRRSRKGCSRSRYSISSDFRVKQRDRSNISDCRAVPG